ncbi:hypothetical protein MBLNU230_g6476t1 [Neophaeotheca triangularis]
MFISHFLSAVAGYATSLQCVFNHDTILQNQPFTFSKEWHVVGPFQLGTREAAWGADPLEHEGGFHNLEYNSNAIFKSSLTPNASVAWSTHDARLGYSSSGKAIAELAVSFPDVPWRALQDVYGWSALQWQGWARGSINVDANETKVLILHTDHVLEYWIDHVRYYGGDFYAYRRAPVTLRLAPGTHTIELRLTRDVRAMGGVDPPDITINLALEETTSDLQPASWEPDSQVMIADVIDGYDGILASTFASSTLRNDGTNNVFITGIEAMPNMCFSKLISETPIKLVPGQTRPIAFKIECVPPISAGPPYWGEYYVDFKYHTASSDEEKILTLFDWPIHFRETQEPHKITFAHPSGIVSYAILRPPSPTSNCTNRTTKPLPILLAFHGAGLEASSDQVRHSLDALPNLCAWALFPTGVTPWSGDDWHSWGIADVEAAVSAIPDWIAHNDWQGPGVDTDRWFVTGHSNGGQGVWYALTHHPDKVIAAAPLSGYTSVQNYVPYTFWQPAEPALTAVVQSAMNDYRHELLLENAKGIPIYLQHGGLDDNVPPYHSRLMHSLLHQVGSESQYMEVPGKPHYWDSVMTTPTLTGFFHAHLDPERGPNRPDNFTLVTASSANTGTKNGFRILHLLDPSKLGRITVSIDPNSQTCHLHPNPNILAFEIHPNAPCERYNINDDHPTASPIPTSEPQIFFRSSDGSFKPRNPGDPALPTRRLGQLGPVDGILGSRGPIAIVQRTRSPEIARLALQISRNLAQYFYADTVIAEHYPLAVAAEKDRGWGNSITLALGSDLPSSASGPAIVADAGGLTITGADGVEHYYPALHPGTLESTGVAALWLRPRAAEDGDGEEALDLVLWAARAEDLGKVARFVPVLTGVGVPEFVVVGEGLGGQGVGGVRAVGWFGGFWEVVTGASVFT